MNSIIWKQYDSRWGSKPYPSGSTMSGCGCGCVACTHVAMEQERYAKWTPENLRPWMVKQGFALRGQGTRWEGITQTLKHLGHRTVVRIYSDPMSEAWKELNKGNRIGVLLFNGRYAPNGVHWTAGGHYVAFTNYKVKDGKHYFYCKDSGGRDHSGWYTYENSMKGCIAKMWIVERVGAQATAKSTETKKSTSSSKLTVDGKGGKATIKAAQKKFGVTQDGIISGQASNLKKYHEAFSTIRYGSGGSNLVKKMQKHVGLNADGQLGVGTIKTWQKYLGVTADGYWGTGTMKAFQKWLNGDLEGKKVKATTTTTTKTSSSSAAVYKVVDVSVWQGNINWKKVKAAGVTGAIIRYADGTTLDSKFEKNMKEAKAAGLHVGAYIFSRAKSASAAEAEAKRLYNACKKYNPDMPLYIDMEWNSASGYANTVAKAYVNKMKKLGGKPGIYANLTWFNRYITTKNFTDYPLWIAQYNSRITHAHPEWFGMWQYSSSGSVSGISGRVDVNKCYKAYWNEK